MSSRASSRLRIALALGFATGAPMAATALERAVQRAPEELVTWARDSECNLVYYNVCTGWIWVWYGWAPGDRVGATFESCAERVVSSRIFVLESADPGYGFTGTISVHAVDASGCPTGPGLAQPFLPVVGWNEHAWSDYPVGSRFAVEITFGAAPDPPVMLVSDHPAIGPDGVFGCGHCYPSTRPTHSFTWGSAAATLCPGDPLFDGTCNAELLLDVTLSGNGPSPVRSAAWSQVKALYR